MQHGHSQVYHFRMKLWTILFLILLFLNFVVEMRLKPGMARPGQLTIIKYWIAVALLLSVVRAFLIGFLQVPSGLVFACAKTQLQGR